jgi:CubicO group peptidase (beta-lactamase class C family)
MKTLTDKVDELFATWDRPDSPGCALGIIENGRFVYRRGYGMANLEHEIPISSETVFRIGSTSKQFTAMAIALLAEQEKIPLDDDIRKYLPEMPEYERPVTVRHLIHHTSGIRDYLELMDLAGMREDDFYTNDEAIEMVTRQKALNFAPGDRYLYSNTGYFLLAVILKRASGQSLREFAEENIFKPLGMENTHFHDDHTEIVTHRAAGYSPGAEGGYRIDMTTLDLVGDGSLFTTVEDLFLWDQNFYHNVLGTGGDDLIRQILTPGTLNDGEEQDYAFGLEVGDYKGLKMVSHGGAFVGFRAEMIRFPEQAFSVICLANLNTISPTRLTRQVADIYLVDRFKEQSTADTTAQAGFVELSAQVLQDKVGVYQSSATGTIVEICVREGKLTARAFGLAVRLAPISATDFLALDALFSIEISFPRPDQDAPCGGDQDRPWLMHLLIEDEKPDTLQAINVMFPGTDQLAEYAGKYSSDELQVTYTLALADSKLYVKHKNAPQNPLQPALKDMFWVNDITLLFSRDDQGQVSGFTVNTRRVKDLHFAKKRL